MPENYEFDHVCLKDIKFNLKPTYKIEDIKKMDQSTKYSKSLEGTEYLPGCTGLNNIKSTDFVNVIIQSFCRIKDLRDFFLFYDESTTISEKDRSKTQTSMRLAEQFRKIWNPINFKSHVSSHELLQAISQKSNKRFRIGQQSDPIQFLIWFINTIHNELKDKFNRSIISECFQGELEIITQHLTEKDGEFQDAGWESEIKSFMVLTLDIPAVPLFKNSGEKNFIPNVPIYELLSVILTFL